MNLPPLGIAALLLEAAFFLLPGIPAAMDRLHGRGRIHLALGLTISAVLPYLVYSLPLGVFRLASLAALAGLAAALAFWYVLLPRKGLTDAAFLALVAGVTLAGVMAGLYLAPAPGLKAEVLGELMWRRLGILAVLLFRPIANVDFGFLPRRKDWWIGMREYAYFLLPGVALSLALGFARFQPAPAWWWKAPATFLGMLWVVALSEEFFFRGLLQQWLGGWLKGEWRGLIAASLLFGLAHLPFRDFPNWKFALLAALAGFFYGRAWRAARGIRAAMVTHALVNTTWRVLFTS